MSTSTAVAPEIDYRIVADEQELDTPLIAVDLDLLERNIAEMAALASSYGVSLRPHAKTHKSPHIARMQIEAGAVGLTCAKLGEAEVLLDQGGIADLLIAYPIVGEIKIRRLLHLLDRAAGGRLVGALVNGIARLEIDVDTCTITRATVLDPRDALSEGAVYLDLRVPGRVAAGGVGPVTPDPAPPILNAQP